ncbi:ATP-binding protein [Flavobacterium sp. GA093]|uniref:ATP-binding protein n=1 Tax=Flavobacterium hydrocarbonoxydans TaxID=2683249 RepID=A0A6I4NNQ6_9FLAO|nr:ATP-binding protein [Flavobacterium hydrocarbonoxydans]MWB95860.1 ATP-binding protein [Flavobacterium hydrocarbonoxydans]
MENNSWDPLVTSKVTDTEVVSAAQKREIKNILKSYVGKYDSFSELIQNSMDAVDKREKDLKEKDYIKKIWIEINLAENSFTIADNGIGFNEKEFKSFLAPNISYKDGEKTRGNKGVGSTYIGYGFNYLEFGTKGNGHEFKGKLVGGRDWVEDFKGIKTRPVVTECIDRNPYFDQIKRGATFKIIFEGDNIRPKDLSWYTAKTPEQWFHLLLLKTPLGSIKYIDNDDTTPIVFDLNVVKKDGTLNTLKDINAAYIFPHNAIKASNSLKEVLMYQTKAIEAGRDSSAIPSRFKRANGIYEFFTTDEILKFRKNDEEFNEIIKLYKVEAYGYFTYSTAVWDQFNDSIANLRKGYRVLRGGLQLANNKMIQGELIAIPLTSNIGYQNQCHIIVHFKDADPDLGRKGFQPELKDQAEKLSVAIVNRFKSWKILLKSDTGAKPDIAKEINLHQWIVAQVEHETKFPLKLTNKNFFAPINEISITSEPQSEQDTVVLFNQLIAGGVIRGINLLATSQVKQYDGIFKFVVKNPLKNHVYNKENNPLGVEELHHSSEFTSPPKVLEYKYNLDALIREFESEYKSEKDIHLAITWEMGTEWKKNYEAISYLDLDNLHQRDFHGITHLLTSGNTKFHVIVLKELMEYLNDVDGVQEFQKEHYGDDLFI